MFIKLVPLICVLLAVVYLIMWLIYRKRLIAAEAYMRELLSLNPSSYLSTNRGFVLWKQSHHGANACCACCFKVY